MEQANSCRFAALFAMTLISKWEISRSLQNFYTGNAPVWTEKTKQLITIANEKVEIRHAFDPDSEEKPYTIEIDGDGVTAVAACHNGKTILTFSRSTLIRKWEREIVVKTSDQGTTEEIVWKQKQSWKGQGGFVSSASVDPTDTLVVTGSTDGSIRVWDIAGGYCTHNFVGHTGIVTRVKFHPRRLAVFSCSDDRSIRGWDLQTSKQLYSLEEHNGKVTDFDLTQSVCPTGPDHLISVANDQTLIMWEAAMGQMIFQIPISIDSFAVCCLPREFAPLANDSKKFLSRFKTDEDRDRAQKLRTRVPYVMVTGGEDGLLRMWDIAAIPKDMREAKPVLSCTSPHAVGGAVGHLIRLTADGQQLLSTGIDLSIAKWGLAKSATRPPLVEREMVGHTPEYFAVKVTTPAVVNGQDPEEAAARTDKSGLTHALVAFLTSDESLRLLDSETMDVVSLRAHRHIIVAVDVSPCGRFAVTADKRGTIKLWSLAALCPIATLTGHVGTVGHVALPRKASSYSGKEISILSAAEDKTVKMWKVSLTEALTANRTVIDRTKAAALFATQLEDALATADPEAATRKGLADSLSSSFAGIASGLRRRWEGANRGVPAAVVFPVGEDALKKAEEEGGAHGVRMTKADWTVVASQRDINALSIAPNDKVFATGGQDKLVRVFDMKTGKQQFELKGHTKAVWSLSFSPIDKVLASGGGDNMIRLWNLVDRSLIRTLQGHDAQVSQVSFFFHKSAAANYISNTDGNVKQDGAVLLMSGDNSGIVRVWVPHTSTCIETADQHSDKIWALDTYQPNSTSPSIVVTGGADGKLGIWKDVSRQEADRVMKEKQDEIQNDSVVHNALRNKDYAAAFKAALTLQRPAACRETLEAWLQSPLTRMLESMDTNRRGKNEGPKVAPAVVVVDDVDVKKKRRNDEDEEDQDNDDAKMEDTSASEGESSSESEQQTEESEAAKKAAAEEALNFLTGAMDIEEYQDEDEAVVEARRDAERAAEEQRVAGLVHSSDAQADKDHLAMVRTLVALDKKLLTRLVAFATDWSSNSKHAWVAASVLDLLISLHGANKLIKTVEGLSDLAQKTVGYLQRNSLRLSALRQKSFILDLTLMDTQAASGWSSRAFSETNQILMGAVAGDESDDDEAEKKRRAAAANRKVIVIGGDESDSDDE